MRAIVVDRFGGPEVLTLRDMPMPAAGPGQVVVRVHAAGVNPVDTYIRAGWYGPKEFPYIPGYDAAGIVESVGAGVTSPARGDRVWVARAPSGTYAEFCVCHDWQARPLPQRLSFAQGAGVHVPYATAWRALFDKGGARAGEIVLIHGASGGVGLACVQLARHAGLTVIGSAGTPEGRRLILDQGGHHAVAHAGQGGAEEVRRLTDDRGPDLIVEMLASASLAADLSLVAPRGRIVVVGSRGSIEIAPRDLMSRDSTVIGMSLNNATPAEQRRIFESLSPGLEGGWLTPVVRCELPLHDAPRAHELVTGPGAHGKIVLVP